MYRWNRGGYRDMQEGGCTRGQHARMQHRPYQSSVKSLPIDDGPPSKGLANFTHCLLVGKAA